MSPCLKKAVEMCSTNAYFARKRCESHHGSPCSAGSDKVVTLTCDSNEKYLNDACYENCFSGSYDLGFFCMKGEVKERYIREFDGRIDINEEMYGVE